MNEAMKLRIKAFCLMAAFSAAFLIGCQRESTTAGGGETLSGAGDSFASLDAMIAQAKAESKLVLLDFTGSDWCPPCKMLQAETLSKPEFLSYANSNLVFVEVDFPNAKKLAAGIESRNETLKNKFQIEGFPTLIALDANGKELWRTVGYGGGGPKPLIAQLEAVRPK
jgi:thiol-disulfide isomerase/thioredoxin